MPQGQRAIVGKRVLGSLYRAIFNEVTIASKGRLTEVAASGDLGYFASTYNLTATPKTGGKRVKSKGKSLFIVKRQAGGPWRIARLMDNSDTAA